MFQELAPPKPDVAPALQRAEGAGRIAVRKERAATRLWRLRQDGCAKVRLPRDADARDLEAVMLNTAGGLTGGDRMAWGVEVAAGAALTLSTQACEKIYRAAGGEAQVRVDLEVDAGGRLDWLPQETILFDRAALSRRLDVDLAPDATLLLVEAVVLGRSAHGETVRSARLHDRWRVRCGGRLVFADDLRLDGPISDVAARAPTLAGARAFASVLLVSPQPERQLAAVRAAFGELGGASAFDGKLFGRVAADDGFALRRALIPALTALRDGADLPRVWRL